MWNTYTLYIVKQLILPLVPFTDFPLIKVAGLFALAT